MNALSLDLKSSNLNSSIMFYDAFFLETLNPKMFLDIIINDTKVMNLAI